MIKQKKRRFWGTGPGEKVYRKKSLTLGLCIGGGACVRIRLHFHQKKVQPALFQKKKEQKIDQSWTGSVWVLLDRTVKKKYGKAQMRGKKM